MSSYLIRPWFLFVACLGTFATPQASPASPSSPFRLFIAPQTLRSGEVTLLWDKSESADTGVTYHVFRDDEPIGDSLKTHFTATGLSPGHVYVFTVKAAPASGDSQLSNPVRVQTPLQEKTISIVDYGAKGDGKTNNTRAIQAAINACPADGVVFIPAGVFVSGALFLKSEMTLEIAAGGILQGSTLAADYEPFILNRFEGWEMKTYASLLNAGALDHGGPFTVRHLSIRGSGKIVGGGAALAKEMIDAHGMRSRGRLICLMNCSDVEIQGLTLEDPPCWTLHYIYCENVSCHDLIINSTVRNGDGLDPDSSRNSYIFNCVFSNGDDCIAIKSGKNPEGNVIGRPTENVRISDCRFLRGHGISIGSEMSGGVRNVLVEDCVAGNLLNGLQIKATKDRGGFVEDVLVRDCDLQKITVLTALNYNNDGAPAPGAPYFRRFRFVDLDLGKADPSKPVIIINGFAESGHRTSDVTFENLKLPNGSIVQVDQAENVRFSRVVTSDGQKPKYEISRSDRVSY